MAADLEPKSRRRRARARCRMHLERLRPRGSCRRMCEPGADSLGTSTPPGPHPVRGASPAPSGQMRCHAPRRHRATVPTHPHELARRARDPVALRSGSESVLHLEPLGGSPQAAGPFLVLDPALPVRRQEGPDDLMRFGPTADGCLIRHGLGWRGG